MSFPGPHIESWGWLEDIDLNAGAAAIAAIAATDQKHVTLSGTDAIVAPEHETYLWGIAAADETPPTTDAGYITISGYSNVKFPLPVVPVGGPGFGEVRYRNPVRIPPGAQLDCLGNGSGSGTEEHAVILYVENPAMQPWPVKNTPGSAFPYFVEMVTDAPPAGVRFTPIEYSGRTNAFEGSVDVLPDLSDVEVYLEALQAELTAGYTVLKLEDNLGEKCLMWPCASTYDRKVFLSDYIGGPLYSRANSCHKVAVAGVSTGTQQMYLDLYVENWKSFGTGRGTGRGGGTSRPSTFGPSAQSTGYVPPSGSFTQGISRAISRYR
jgi:hypothetical protein